MLSKRKRLQYYKSHIENVIPPDFVVESSNNKITVTLSQLDELVSRRDMPQIKSDEVVVMIKKFQKLGIPLSTGTIHPKECIPTQKQLYRKKINNIVSSIKKYGMEEIHPIFISNDGYIIDGHHRWAACRASFPDEMLRFVRVKLPIEIALQITKTLTNK